MAGSFRRGGGVTPPPIRYTPLKIPSPKVLLPSGYFWQGTSEGYTSPNTIHPSGYPPPKVPLPSGTSEEGGRRGEGYHLLKHDTTLWISHLLRLPYPQELQREEGGRVLIQREEDTVLASYPWIPPVPKAQLP